MRYWGGFQLGFFVKLSVVFPGKIKEAAVEMIDSILLVNAGEASTQQVYGSLTGTAK